MSFLSNAKIIVTALNEYHQQSISRKKPVIDQIPIEKIINDLELSSFIRTGGLSEESLSQFISKYLDSTTRLHHPAYLAHQVSVPHYAGALAALIDGFTNNPMAIYEMGPGAASIEYHIVNWLLEKVGWQPAPLKNQKDSDQTFAGGVLTHGGSLANLTALIAARKRMVPNVWQEGNPSDLALLAPDECHYSIARAAGILGIGRHAIYRLDVDRKGVVVPDRLATAYQRVESEGKRPMALIANACSTSVGLYDPLQEMGEFCQEKNLWFHIDGAHGAAALLSKKHRKLMKGVRLADSLIWDAHKLMRTPVLCAAVLVRDYRTLDNAFEQEASYIFHDKDQPGIDFIHRTVECTKAGLGLKLFMVLAAIGEQGVAEYIDRQFQLTIEAYEYFQRLPDFECAVKPQSNILCFRVKGDDSLQLKLRDRLINQGDFYLSTAAINDKRYMRLVFMHPNTNMNDVERLVHKIKQLVNDMVTAQ